uniref:DUF945 family protein n=1 Tax=Thaumasiovibrio occultus TaxID=1891184 RepID=UPI000B355511|nr:DUF945 family protein [Thaumasiovibrio occultus]
MKKWMFIVFVVSFSIWPFAVGQWVKNDIVAFIAEVDSPDIGTEITEYKTGYYESEFRTDVTVFEPTRNDGSRNSYTFTFVTKVYHGYFGVRTETEIELTQRQRLVASYIWPDDDVPLRIDVNKNLIGPYNFRLAISQVFLQQPTLVAVASAFYIDGTFEKGRVDAGIAWPTVLVLEKEEDVATQSYEMFDISGQVNGRFEQGMLVGDVKMSAAESVWGYEKRATLQGVNLSISSSISGDKRSKSHRIDFGVRAYNGNDNKLENLRLVSDIRGSGSEAIFSFWDLINTQVDPMSSQNLIDKTVAKLLRKGVTSFYIGMDGQYQGQPFGADLRLQMPAAVGFAASNIKEAVNNAQGELKVNLDRGYSAYFLGESTDSWLNLLADRGALSRQENRLIGRLELQRSQLTNALGNNVPLSALNIQ